MIDFYENLVMVKTSKVNNDAKAKGYGTKIAG